VSTEEGVPCVHRRDRDIAIVEASGSYGVGELRAAFDAALTANDDMAARGLLLDVSASESLADRTSQEVRAMAYFVASLGDRFARRFAIIAPSDLAFGMMRLGSVVTEAEGVETNVFRDREAAMAWLTGTPA
jgi:hypothetical protein